MITFEVLLNGEPLYTMDAGDLGSLCVNIGWMRGKNPLGVVSDHPHVHSFALNNARKSHHYQNPELKIGDEITVRVIVADVRDTHITHPTWWK